MERRRVTNGRKEYFDGERWRPMPEADAKIRRGSGISGSSSYEGDQDYYYDDDDSTWRTMPSMSEEELASWNRQRRDAVLDLEARTLGNQLKRLRRLPLAARLFMLILFVAAGLLLLALFLASTFRSDDPTGLDRDEDTQITVPDDSLGVSSDETTTSVAGSGTTATATDDADEIVDAVLALTDCSWFPDVFGAEVSESFTPPGGNNRFPDAAVLSCSTRAGAGNFPDVAGALVYAYPDEATARARFEEIRSVVESVRAQDADQCVDPIAGVECFVETVLDTTDEFAYVAGETQCFLAGAQVSGDPYVRYATLGAETHTERVFKDGTFVVRLIGDLGGEVCETTSADPVEWIDSMLAAIEPLLAEAQAE